MRVNWLVRLKNKTFWLSFIPALLLLVQVIASVFGYSLEFGELGNKLLAVVNAVFALLSILGIVTDPTTSGVSDSERAMGYTEPKTDADTNTDTDTESVD
ncbi:MAG: phage holin [Clostridiales bacterium]|nr:phage holin [Clostridiales bacterium]